MKDATIFTVQCLKYLCKCGTYKALVSIVFDFVVFLVVFVVGGSVVLLVVHVGTTLSVGKVVVVLQSSLVPMAQLVEGMVLPQM